MNLRIIALLVSVTGALAVPPTITWPANAPALIADEASALGGNVSGLAVVSQTRLLAVRDDPGSLLQLDRTATGWVVTPGWGKGRELLYVDGTDSPDAEAVTTVSGDDGAVYVGAERDSDKPNTPRNTILRYDTAGLGSLRATMQWELDRVLPAANANSGIEGLTWIPDDVFVSMGFRDATGKTYAPSDYPGHGAGLFVVGHEQSGSLFVVALRDDSTVALVASMPSGLGSLMEVVWHAERRELWALCDNSCGGLATVWKPATGSFELVAEVLPPAGMASLNNEGFALSPRCVDSTYFAVWSDDGATDKHVLRETTLPCSPITISNEPLQTIPSTTKQEIGAAPSVDDTSVEDTSTDDGASPAALVTVLIALVVVGAGVAGAITAHRRRRA